MNPGDGNEQDYWQNEDESLSAQPAEVTQQAVQSESLSWQASEAIHHEKHMLWFVGLLAATVFLLAVSIFLIRSWTFAVLIVVMAITVGVLGSRPPRVNSYQLNSQSLQVNDKTFSLHDFRAFGVLQDGPLYSVVLIPHKRFMPSVNVYFPAESGEQIVDIFGASLPMEHVEPDVIDRLSRKLRF